MSVPVQKLAAPRPLEAKITLRVGEEGGRAVERSVTLPILPEGPVVGVRKNFGGDLAEGATATFDVVMAAPDGTRQARQGVAWNLYRVERRYQWFNSDGRWGFEPVKSTKRVADGRIDVSAAEPARIATPVEWGTLPPRRARRRRRERADERVVHGRLVAATRPPTRPTSST